MSPKIRNVYGPAAVGKKTDSYAARLAEAGLERKVARLLAEGDLAWSVASRPSTGCSAWRDRSNSSPLFWPVYTGSSMKPTLDAVLADLALLVGESDADADEHRQRGAEDGDPSNASEHWLFLLVLGRSAPGSVRFSTRKRTRGEEHGRRRHWPR